MRLGLLTIHGEEHQVTPLRPFQIIKPSILTHRLGRIDIEQQGKNMKFHGEPDEHLVLVL
jgi:hypothetical protein